MVHTIIVHAYWPHTMYIHVALYDVYNDITYLYNIHMTTYIDLAFHCQW